MQGIEQRDKRKVFKLMTDTTIFVNMNFTRCFTQFDNDTTQRQKVFKGLMHQLEVAVAAPTNLAALWLHISRQWETLGMFLWSWRKSGVYMGPLSSNRKGNRKARSEELKVIR